MRLKEDVRIALDGVVAAGKFTFRIEGDDASEGGFEEGADKGF